MGQLRCVIERSNMRMSAMRLRRGELHATNSEQQRKQCKPTSHGDLCLSAAAIRPLRGKA